MVLEGFAVNQVSKTYMDEKQRPFQVLRDVSFSWSTGENIAVLGESGSGKSTLARLLIGIEKPNSGTITWNGEDITRWKASAWRKKRRHIQAVFQDASGTLNPARSVYHNVEEALRNLTQLDKRQRRARIDELMELTHMDSHLLQIPVRQLSGANSAAFLCSGPSPFIRNFWCWMKSPVDWTFFPRMRYCRSWSVTTRNLAVLIC